VFLNAHFEKYARNYIMLELPGSIPSQGPRHTKDVIKMVPVVPLFSNI